MQKPNRDPDFTSSGVEFYFEPDMMEVYEKSPYTSISYKLIEHEGKIYRKQVQDNMLWHCTVQEAYREYRKKLDKEIDKILLS